MLYNYQTMPHKSPDERRTRFHRDGSLKSRSNSAYFNIFQYIALQFNLRKWKKFKNISNGMASCADAI